MKYDTEDIVDRDIFKKAACPTYGLEKKSQGCNGLCICQIEM